jgi:hypothetical protein
MSHTAKTETHVPTPKRQRGQVTAAEASAPRGPVGRWNRLRYTLPGSWGALFFACLSFTRRCSRAEVWPRRHLRGYRGHRVRRRRAGGVDLARLRGS